LTEIPEHLLARSRERRAALGLGGGDQGGADAAAPSQPTQSSAPAAAKPAQAPAAAAPAAPPAPPPPPPPPPPYVVAAHNRPTIPRWAVPVLAMLPIWAYVYAGVLDVPEAAITDPVLAQGEQIYSSCAGCHGSSGQGGTGPPLAGGEVLLTFPDPQDHIEWVTEGSPGGGTPYGNPDRPGGQRISQGGMPGFGEQLSEEEIIAVVRYEREVLSGEEASALAGEEGGDPGGEAEAEGGDIGTEEGAGEGGAESGGGEPAGGG
jgi:mono/diheme cytochrome c family protein